MDPKVSVIVIAYEVEAYIGACLESLARQTMSGLEIIVVNDGSQDGTQSIVDGYVARYPQLFRSFVKENGGPSSARNLGLDEARGEYVAFVDGDDTVKKDMYEVLYAKAVETGAELVVSGYVAVDHETGARTYHRQGWAKHFGHSVGERPDYLLTVSAYVWNKLFSRNLFERTGIRFPEGRLFEDIPVMYCLLVEANRVAKVQRGLYNYTRYRTGAITHSYSERNLEMLETLGILNDYYRRRGLFETFEEQLLVLNYRHIHNRFEELPRYGGLEIKQRMVTEGIRHLDANFPEWRTSDVLDSRYGRYWRFGVFKHPLLVHLYAFLPGWVHRAGDRLAGWRRSAEVLWRRFGTDRRRILQYARSVRRLPVQPNVALFETFHGSSTSDSPFYLMRDLARRGTHHVYVAVKDVQSTQAVLDRYGIAATPVVYGSRHYDRLLATAGYLVNNVTFPPFFIKRAEQVYLNTWHGTPLKTLGRAMPYGLRDLANTQRNFLKSDWVLSTNAYTRDILERDYMFDRGFSGRHDVVAAPRNEALLDRSRAGAVRAELGVDAKQVFFYMPTWRGGDTRNVEKNSFLAHLEEHLSVLDSALRDDQVMFVKLHHLAASEVDLTQFTRVRLAPSDYETYDLLNIADVLITDYSSVFFDFAITGREIVLFAYDRDEYTAERDFYLDFDELPFRRVATIEELTAFVRIAGPFTADDRYKAFAEQYAPDDSRGAAQRINDLVLAERAPSTPKLVDVVFLPFLDNKGRKRLCKLLTKGYDRDDVYFVFSIRRDYAQANAFLFQRFVGDDSSLRFIVSSGRMTLTAMDSIALALNRRFGWFQDAAERAYRVEAQRLFGDLKIRSAEDFSKYRKFRGIAAALQRQLETEDTTA